MHPASFLAGALVANPEGQNVGKVEEIIIDESSGVIAYAVVSFDASLRMGDSLFPMPWETLTLDGENRRFILKVSAETLEEAPGFEKEHWPDMADREWGEVIYTYYGCRPFWE